MRTDLSELIERVEKATGPDREIDGRIWCAVNGYVFVMWDGAGCVYREAPEGNIRHIDENSVSRVTVSLDAAVALVERMLPADEGADHEKSEIRIQYGDFGCNAVISRDTFTVDRSFSAAHKTPALALILALLRSLQHQDPRDDR